MACDSFFRNQEAVAIRFVHLVAIPGRIDPLKEVRYHEILRVPILTTRYVTLALCAGLSFSMMTHRRIRKIRCIPPASTLLLYRS